MDAPALARFRSQLEHERDALIAEGDVRIDPNREDAGITKTDEDAQPLNEMEQVIASKRNVERTKRLVQIQAALARLLRTPDDFGLCEACDEDIAARRMQVMPWSRFCVRCQSKRDPERGVARRSLTDYD